MTIRIMCPNLKCRRILAVPLEARGKTIRCKSCGTMVKVPRPAERKTAATSSAAHTTDDEAPAADS